jgi:hypothetical protein
VPQVAKDLVNGTIHGQLVLSESALSTFLGNAAGSTAGLLLNDPALGTLACTLLAKKN